VKRHVGRSVRCSMKIGTSPLVRRMPEVEEILIGVTGVIQIAWRGGHPKYSSLVSDNSVKVPISVTSSTSALTFRLYDFSTLSQSLLSCLSLPPHGCSVLAKSLTLGRSAFCLHSGVDTVNKPADDQHHLQHEDFRRCIHSCGSCYCIRELGLRSN
jgi:hypothetical protein